MPNPEQRRWGTRHARPFVGREEHLAAFRRSSLRDPAAGSSVVNLFGVGGVGKTRLLREMQGLARDEFPDMRILAHDFEEQSSGDCGDVLFALWKMLCQREVVDFPRFDVAQRVYWGKCHIASMRSLSPYEGLGSGWWQTADTMVDLIDQAGVPIVKLAHTLVTKARRKIDHRRANSSIAGNEELSMVPDWPASTIREHLPLFWADDLRDAMAAGGFGVAVFLDTYEAIWDGDRRESIEFSRDAWIRNLVATLPEITWVISGREPLRWAAADRSWGAVIESWELKGLPPPQVERFLHECGVSDEDVVEAIVSASGGHPFYLDLAVDHWEHLVARGDAAPVPDDFGKTPEELYSVFIRHLDNSEILALKVLACARRGDIGLFGRMLSAFDTGYPDLACSRLLRFSFFDHEGDSVAMHELMRAILSERLRLESPDAYRRVHRWLHDYHGEGLRDLTQRSVAEGAIGRFREAAHHARKALGPEELLDWLYECSLPFGGASQFMLVADQFGRALSIATPLLGDSDLRVLRAQIRRALALAHAGRFAHAGSLLDDVVESSRGASREVRLLHAAALDALGYAQRQDGRQRDSERSTRRALEVRIAELGPDAPEIAATLMHLSWPLRRCGRLREAEESVNRALAIWEGDQAAHAAAIAAALSSRAEILFRQYRYVDAERDARKALERVGVTIGENSAAYSTALSNLAAIMAYTARTAEAEQLYRASAEIARNALDDEHPHRAAVLTSLARLLGHMDRPAEALAGARAAADIRCSTSGPAHPGSVAARSLVVQFMHATDDVAGAIALGDDILRDVRGIAIRDDCRILEAAAVVAQAHVRGGHGEAAVRIGRDALLLMESAARGSLERTISAVAAIGESFASHGCGDLVVEALTDLLALAGSSAGGPLAEAAAHLALADLIYRLGRPEDAASHGDAAIRLRLAELGESDEEILAARERLGCILRDVPARHEEAAALLASIQGDVDSFCGPWSPRSVCVAGWRVDVMMKLNRREEAADLWADVVAVLEEARGAGHENVAYALKRLAGLYPLPGRSAEAVAALRRAHAIEVAIHGHRHADTAATAIRLCDMLDRSRRGDDALALLLEHFWLFEGDIRSDKTRILKFVPRLAKLLAAHGRDEDAETILRWALTAQRDSRGPDALETLNAESWLAGLLGRSGRQSEAADLYEDVVERRRSLLGSEHPDTLDAILKLARNLAEIGKTNRAEALLYEAKATAALGLGDDHVLTRRADTQMERLSRSHGRSADSKPGTTGNADDGRAKELLRQAREASFAGDIVSAEALYRDALSSHREVLGAAHPATLAAAKQLAGLLGHCRRNEEAVPLLEEFLAAAVSGGAPAESLVGLRAELARHLNFAKRHAEAEALCRDVLADCGAVQSTDPLAFADVNEQLAMALNRLHRHEEAEGPLQTALQAAVGARGKVEKRSQRLARSLAWTLDRLGKESAGRAIRVEYGIWST